MIYIIHGYENYLIDKKIKEIIAENSDAVCQKIDGSDKIFEVNILVDSLNEISLFAEKKVILLNNPIFLNKKINEEDIQSFLDYCKHPSYENTLIIYNLDGVFNERLKVYKDVASNAQIFKYDKLKGNNFYNSCIAIIKEHKLELKRDIINYLVNNANNSLSIFNKNVEILELYPEPLNLEIVVNLCTNSDEILIFDLINALVNKKISEAIKLSRKLVSQEDHIYGLLALLANQLRFLYEVAYYRDSGKTKGEILSLTGLANSFRLDKAFESLEKLKKKEILVLLDKIADLDYECKSNNDLREDERLELLIISLLNNEKS